MQYIHTPIHLYIHTPIHLYIHTPIHLCIHTPMHPYTNTHIHPYTYTPIHPYAYTPIHLDTYTLLHRYILNQKASHQSSCSSEHQWLGETEHFVHQDYPLMGTIFKLLPVWQYWAIYCTLGNISKSLTTIINCPHFKAIFVKVSKAFIFLLKSFLGNFYRHLATFYWSHWLLPPTLSAQHKIILASVNEAQLKTQN